MNQRAVWLLAVLAAVPGLSCEKDRPTCGEPVPAFRLELAAEAGQVPRDTRLTVVYQGSLTETHVLGGDNSANEDLCCVLGRPTASPLPPVHCRRGTPLVEASVREGGSDAQVPGVEADSGAAGAPREALLCELWTNGAAELTVQTAAYPELRQGLEAKSAGSQCGLRTVDVHLMLLHGDGGP